MKIRSPWPKRATMLIALFLVAWWVATCQNEAQAWDLEVGYPIPARTSGVTGQGQWHIGFWTPDEKWQFGATQLDSQHIAKWRTDIEKFWFVYGQRCGWYRQSRALRPHFCVGIAALPGGSQPPLVSLPLTFHLTAGLDFNRRASISWRHMSNAGLKRPNTGQDWILLAVRF